MQLVEVSTVTELAIAVEAPGVVAVALDAPQPGAFTEAVAAAGSLPVLRPLWRRQRNTRGDIDEVFDGYGLLTATDVGGLPMVSCRSADHLRRPLPQCPNTVRPMNFSFRSYGKAVIRRHHGTQRHHVAPALLLPQTPFPLEGTISHQTREAQGSPRAMRGFVRARSDTAIGLRRALGAPP